MAEAGQTTAAPIRIPLRLLGLSRALLSTREQLDEGASRIVF
jgi:hypothetical protein